MNSFPSAIAAASVFAITSFAATTFADDPDSGSAAADAAKPAAVTANANTQVQGYSRRVYKVDDVGIIIGGASEDAKAKVGRLPVQK